MPRSDKEGLDRSYSKEGAYKRENSSRLSFPIAFNVLLVFLDLKETEP